MLSEEPFRSASLGENPLCHPPPAQCLVHVPRSPTWKVERECCVLLKWFNIHVKGVLLTWEAACSCGRCASCCSRGQLIARAGVHSLIQSLAYLVLDLLMEEASVEMFLPGDSGSPRAQQNLLIWVALLSLPLPSRRGGGDAAENPGLPGERMGLRKKEKIGSQMRFPYLFFFFPFLPELIRDGCITETCESMSVSFCVLVY